MNKDSTNQSLITRSGIALGILVFVSVLNMVITFLSAEHAQNDAVRINIAGSLRMQSYRVAEALLLERTDIQYQNVGLAEQLREFERRFEQPVLAMYLRNAGDEALGEIYQRLEKNWQQIRVSAESPQRDDATLLVEIDEFVVVIDNLVKTLEMQTESKLKLLRTLQGVSMFITVIIVVVILLDLNSTLVGPLRKLVVMAKRMRGGDFSMRLNVDRHDELALLSETLNTTAGSLQAMYGDLEKKVQEKTCHLEQARDELSLLYETSRLLAGEGAIRTRLYQVLDRVKQHYSASQVRVEVSAFKGGRGIGMVVPEHQNLEEQAGLVQHRCAIERHGTDWGELVLCSTMQAQPAGQKATLQIVAANIAAAFSAESEHEQRHRLVLMEERNVIARELHDSLAQTLSYLKIQVSRLQMLMAKNAEQPVIDETLDQVKQAISAAYVQLRELLSTFRLQLSSEGLRAALAATVEEFAGRGELAIELDYQLDDVPLSPNEEIHVLQTVREALSNVMRHSRACRACIGALLISPRRVEISVVDDGIGFGQQQSIGNHYGMVIMQERADTLDGEVRFDNVETGGARMVLGFTPAALSGAAQANRA